MCVYDVHVSLLELVLALYDCSRQAHAQDINVILNTRHVHTGSHVSMYVQAYTRTYAYTDVYMHAYEYIYIHASI